MRRLLLGALVLLSSLSAVAQPVLAGLQGTAVTGPGSYDGYAHPEWLVDSSWLSEQLGDPDIAIVALTPMPDFVTAHIPGAAQIDVSALAIAETDDQSVAAWRSGIEAVLTNLGIERDHTVVIYDGGTFQASRLWWILHQLSHEDVRILNGGLEAWVEHGLEVEAGTSAVAPAATPYKGIPNEAAIAQISEVEAALGRDDIVLVDSRNPDEYAEGHIPGAVNVPFTDNAAAGPKYWKSAAELLAMYESAGVTSDLLVIVYCASGVRSSATYFALLQLGYPDLTLFSGSFNEWASDPNRPVTTGDQP